MAKLYPPVIEGTIPAFNGTVLTVPFSMNRSVSESQVGELALQVKTVQTNTYITTLFGNANAEKTMGKFKTTGSDWTPVPGQYYKLQLAYVNNGEVGYFSTVGVVKYTEINDTALGLWSSDGDNMLQQRNEWNNFKHSYVGTYTYDVDPMEKAYSYEFQICDESSKVIYTSGTRLHDVSKDTLNVSTDEYTFLDDLDDNKKYYLRYIVTTVNGLSLVTADVPLIAAEELTVNLNVSLTARNNPENGYIELLMAADMDPTTQIEKFISGKFKIYRQNIEYPKRWEPIFTFVLQSEQPSAYTWRDFTIEHGKTYKYKLCQFSKSNITATVGYSEEVYADFEDMFLFDGKRQLKIQFNPKVSSFKNDILESKLDTIGSQYPFFFRNGHVHYKEFPISGLISYWVDNEELFIPLTKIGLAENNLTRNASAQDKIYNNQIVYSYTYGDENDRDSTGQVYKTETKYNLTPGQVQSYRNAGYEVELERPSRTFDLKDSEGHVILDSEGHKKQRTIDSIWRITNNANTIALHGKRVEDSNKYFLHNNFKTTNLVNYNIAAERQFKLDVLEWLTNGKPKLFRSPTEGNYIVRLMNTSLTPTDTVGRMLHTFNCTAYEIDAYNYTTLGNYGFVSSDTVSNDTTKLRFRTVRLRDLCNVSSNIYWADSSHTQIEVLKNPYGNHNRLIAQSVSIEDCQYGDKFTINNVDIVIGATLSYNIDNLFEINSIMFKPSEIAALRSGSDAMFDDPIITYSYYDSFEGDSLFDNITQITTGTVPAIQVTRTNMNMYTDNIVNDIENVKTSVIKYNRILLEKRPVEEIYSIVNMDLESTLWKLNRGPTVIDGQVIPGGMSDDEFDFVFTFDRKNPSISNALLPEQYRPSHIAKSMPFYIFHISPTVVLADDIATEIRTYRTEILQMANLAGVTLTLEDLLTKTKEQIWEMFPLTHQTAALNQALIQFNVWRERALIGDGSIQTNEHAYILTTDTVREPNKTYYIKVKTTTEGNEIHEVYVVYDGDLIEPISPVYEYKNIVIPLSETLEDLYLNFDVEWTSYNTDYYVYYDTTTQRFRMFDNNTYSTKVYFNTSELNGLTLGENREPTASPYIDLRDAVQPALYLNLDRLTDFYIGNGILATITYTYSTTSYEFEDSESNILDAKDLYERGLARYAEYVKEWTIPSGNTIVDPSQDIATEVVGNETSIWYFDGQQYPWQQWLAHAKDDYITKLTARVELWREENRVDGL